MQDYSRQVNPLNESGLKRCESCSRQFPAQGRFCPSCGAPAGEAVRPTNEKMTWDIGISILSNPIILKQLAIVIGLSVFVLVLFMFFLGLVDGTLDREYFAFLGKLFLFMFLGFCVLTGLGVLLLLGNRYGYTYTIDANGIREATQPSQYRRNTFLNTLTVILSFFARNPATMGSAVLAQSRQKQFIKWKDINKVEAEPWRKAIILKKNRSTRMVVFCHAENYAPVYAVIRKHTQINN